MVSIDSFIGDKELSVSDAMRLIDNNSYGILFLTSDNKELLSCITDGDIRRYLLSGGKTTDKALEASNKNPRIAKSFEEAKRIYHKKNTIVVPVVDESGRVIDMYFGETVEENTEKCNLNIPVVINAGGKGTRLDPFTRVLPKPLIPVGDLPIIEHIMKEFKSFGCNDFSIIVNYKKQLIKAYFSESENKYDIDFYDEEKPLDTGGGLSLLKGKINSTFFFTNCDILLKSNYEKMLRFHKENENVITMICADKTVTIPYGVIKTDETGKINEMQEKPEFSFLTNTGMYIVEPKVLNDIEKEVPISFPEIIEMQKAKGRRVAAYVVHESEWMDMGELSGLEKMQNSYTSLLW